MYERVEYMKKYLIVICLFILVSCIRNTGNSLVATKEPKYNRKLSSSEQIDQSEILTDIHKSNDISKDTETNNQQSFYYKPANNKKNDEHGKLETKNEDKISYGAMKYEDATIYFKVLDPKYDNTKDKNTSGYITKGENGLKRREIRKVYINRKYSYTETVKDTYILKEPVHEQKWIGTKEILLEPEKKPTPPKEEVSKPKDKMVIDGETWYLYKSFDNADACIANINQLQDEHYREWEGGSMCWSEDLYYSLGR